MPPLSSTSIKIIPLIIMALFSQPAHAEQGREQSVSKQISSEIQESCQKITTLTREQRDDAVVAAQRELVALDQSIDRLQSDLEQRWQTMSEGARHESHMALSALRKQRNDTAQWLGGLRYSSKETWDEVKQGFNESLGQLKNTFARMRDNIAPEE